jgi:hypothetical protein
LLLCRAQVRSVRGVRDSDLANIQAALEAEAQQNLGMAMIFTLAQSAKVLLREVVMGSPEGNTGPSQLERDEAEKAAKQKVSGAGARLAPSHSGEPSPHVPVRCVRRTCTTSTVACGVSRSEGAVATSAAGEGAHGPLLAVGGAWQPSLPGQPVEVEGDESEAAHCAQPLVCHVAAAP